MKTIRNLLAVLGLSALALVANGQEAEDEAASPPPPAEAAADNTVENTTDATADDATPAASDDEFVPTVEVQADEEITFPVDI